ncbi:MAG: Asp-tRNA(Asn)/Glu-tRNA(Gln) amidotransferase subunit GatA [Candidatus Pacebacteria bacterium]|nr:Asp-tRNA(Asn)/Glu-tRNA(Gln) amidotransferase subunit GatA [Candidatus Paceibacterota bacterium]
MDIKNLTIKQVSSDLREKKYSAFDLCVQCVKNIEEKNSELNAVLEVFSDWEIQARDADEKISKGEANPMCGVPVIIKDNILFVDHRVSAASKILENYIATYSATVVQKLRDAGAVIIGRANMDEFAMGSSTENSAYGVVKNPYDNERVAGGSSGGSAVCVASGFCVASLGTDTAGSIRQPASFCGVVGFKSSYGFTSRYGAIAMGNSLDQIGPITKTSEDAEIIQNCIGGFDEKDATSVNENLKPKQKEIKTLGVPWNEIRKEGIDPEVLENFEKTVKKLENSGFKIVDISMPNMSYSLAAYYILMPAEVSTNLARFDGIRYGLREDGGNLFDVYANTKAKGFGPETRRRVILGAYVLSHGYFDAYYRKALLVRDLIKKEFNEAFTKVDAIVSPTAPTPAFKIGEKVKDPVSMYLSDIFTVPANIAGLPAISIPNGFNKDGLPLDIHLVSDFGQDESVLGFGKAFERLQ